MSEKVKEIATEDFQRARVLAQDAVRSGAYLYPIKVGWKYDVYRNILKLRIGHRLLFHPPQFMEAPSLQTRPYRNPRTRRYRLHVCFYLSTSSRSPYHIQ